MMDRLQNVMRAHAVMAGQNRAGTRVGIISAYDPNSYSVKVQFPPANEDGVLPETGWLPLGTIGVGQNWGVVVGPNIGDQVEVEFQDGSAGGPMVSSRFFSTQAVPPPVPSGEIWAVHPSGAFFKLTNDGKGTFNDSKGGSVTLNGDGTVTSTGNWTHQGQLTVTEAAVFEQNVTVDGSTSVKAISSNGHDISSTHQHLNSGGSGLGGVPQ